MKIVAVVNQKGGVGKTTLTINFAADLASRGFRVLVIDADPQGNATAGLGVQRDTVKNTTFEVLLQKATINQAITPTPLKGLDIIPANINLAGVDHRMVNVIARETRLKRAIGSMEGKEYDYILIDCPPSLGILTVNSLCAADEVIIPMQLEYYSIMGLGELMSTITLIRDNLNPTLAIRGIVLTFYDSRTNLSQTIEGTLREKTTDRIFTTTIPKSIKAGESALVGAPLLMNEPSSRIAEAYRGLVNEYLEE